MIEKPQFDEYFGGNQVGVGLTNLAKSLVYAADRIAEALMAKPIPPAPSVYPQPTPYAPVQTIPNVYPTPYVTYTASGGTD